MNLYLAGSYHNLLKQQNYPYILMSYFYESKKSLKDFDHVNVFIDSGAFTAFTKGVEINVYKYCQWLKDNESNIKQYSVLDDMTDPEITYNNQKIMEQEGLTPLPCYHAKEPFKYLEYYCENYDYFSIGGLVPYSKQKKTLIYILDEIFNIIKKYWPKKIHGFGMTALDILERYPFYSTDSGSWMGGAIRSEINVLNFNNFETYFTKEKEVLNSFPLLTLDLLDYEDKKNYINRLLFNKDTYMGINNYITNLWNIRGVLWN